MMKSISVMSDEEKRILSARLERLTARSEVLALKLKEFIDMFLDESTQSEDRGIVAVHAVALLASRAFHALVSQGGQIQFLSTVTGAVPRDGRTGQPVNMDDNSEVVEVLHP